MPCRESALLQGGIAGASCRKPLVTHVDRRDIGASLTFLATLDIFSE
jgi:hypothetical protein